MKQGKELAESHGLEYFETSAKQNQNDCSNALDVLIKTKKRHYMNMPVRSIMIKSFPID
ncbi:Hypothetical predicted protein, partial [Paramuricea clavata]